MKKTNMSRILNQKNKNAYKKCLNTVEKLCQQIRNGPYFIFMSLVPLQAHCQII